MSIDTSTTTEKPIAVAAVKAIHLICWRSSRSPDRYRTVIAAVETAIKAMNTNQAWLMVPISTVDSGAGKDRTPSGFWTTAERPPGAGSCTFFGWTRNPIKVSAMSSRHSPPTGRQRGDGRCPVGKSRNMNAMPQISGKKDHSASTPTIAGPGRVPGCLMPSTAYAERRDTKPSAMPARSRYQPMTLPARRTISAPRVAYKTADGTWQTVSIASPVTRSFQARTIRTRAAAAIATAAAHAAAAAMCCRRAVTFMRPGARSRRTGRPGWPE